MKILLSAIIPGLLWNIAACDRSRLIDGGRQKQYYNQLVGGLGMRSVLKQFGV